jgi:DNA polymerase III gamma/tau subunit
VTDLPIQAPPHQAIYRRWRAQTFAQVVGQEAVV